MALQKITEGITGAQAADIIYNNDLENQQTGDAATAQASAATEKAGAAEELARSASLQAAALETKAAQALDTALEAIAIAEDVQTNSIPNTEKGQPGGVATLDENGEVVQAQKLDLVDSYTSTRTDAAPTANALRLLYVFHQEDYAKFADELAAMQNLIEGVAGLGVAPTSIEAIGAESTVNITIVTNGDWTISSGADWITPDKESGNKNAVVVLTIEANSAEEAREGTVTVSTPLGYTATVNVTQEAVVITTEYTLTPSPASLFFPGAGERKTFEVISQKQTLWNGVPHGDPQDVPYTQAIAGNWFTLEEGAVTAPNNASTNTPSDTITITQEESGKTATIALSQAAGVQTTEYGPWITQSIAITSTAASIAAAGGSATLACRATQARDKYVKWNGVTTSTTQEQQEIGVTAAYSKVSGEGSVSGNVVTFDNNTTEAKRGGTFRATYDEKTSDIIIEQAAGVKVYGVWTVAIGSLTTSFGAGGGTAIVSTAATRPYTWNGVAGSLDYERATPPVQWANGSGYTGFSLSGTTLIAANRGTEVGASRSCVLRASIDGVYQDLTLTQAENRITQTVPGEWVKNIPLGYRERVITDYYSSGATGTRTESQSGTFYTEDTGELTGCHCLPGSRTQKCYRKLKESVRWPDGTSDFVQYIDGEEVYSEPTYTNYNEVLDSYSECRGSILWDITTYADITYYECTGEEAYRSNERVEQYEVGESSDCY